MSVTKSTTTVQKTSDAQTSERSWSLPVPGPKAVSYHELGDQHVIHHDELEVLNLQLKQLEDLIDRVSFMSRELRSSMKVK